MGIKKGLIYGIDLGIASVGWAILDENGNKCVDKGVVLFNEASKAEDRRNSRSARRRLHRRKYRVERMKKLLEKYNLPSELRQDTELLTKRISGLKEKIDLQDITNIIMYFVVHRGYIPFDDETRESELVIKLKQEYEYPCLIQSELLKLNNKYRTTEHPILHEDYNKELIKILDTQGKYYSQITSEFIAEVLGIIDTKRKFWEGPGAPAENALTPYGRYRNLKDLEEYRKDTNYRKYLFTDLIGACSIYANEKKAPMGNFYAELFNFYNDFVNLRIPKSQVNERNKQYLTFNSGVNESKIYNFTTEGIQKIEKIIFETDKVNIEKILKDNFGIEEFFGYKRDSDGKPELARFQITKKIRNKIEDTDRYKLLFEQHLDLYNEIVYRIQVSPDKNSRYEMIKEVIENSNVKELSDESFIQNLSIITLDNEYHSYSEKALRKYLEYMWQDNMNSSNVSQKYKEEIASDIEDEIIEEYLSNIDQNIGLKYINDKFIEDIFASPAVKKSLRKAIAVLNKLFVKYGYPEYICIETARELLSQEKQKEYEQKTLDNAQKREKARKQIEADGMITDANNIETYIDKYLLLQETGFKCAYCNRDIKLTNCEIEHILPISLTSDNSFDNRTAACTECNHIKGNKTPYQFLRETGRYDEFKARVIKNSNYSRRKKEYLLSEEDINKYEKKFKHRNLNDTAYATNELANQIMMFKKAYEESNNEELKTRVIRIPGAMTHMCRTKFRAKKDRNLKYHHAVDAVIIANYATTKLGKLVDMIQNEKEQYWRSANMQDYRNEDIMFNNILANKNILDTIKNADFSNTRVSREVVKKYTGQLFDANIRKAIIKDNEYYYIDQIDNIYELSHSDVEKKILGNELLIKEKNPKLYKKLLDIIEQYKDAKGNQFVNYCKENLDVDWTKTTFNPSVHGIRVTNKANSDVVIKLRFLTKMTIPFILNKNSIDSKEDTINVCTSLSSYCTRVFTDEEKLYFMPMYKVFIDQKTGKINEEHYYYKEIYNKFVGNANCKFLMDLYNNDYVRFEKKNGDVVEGYISYFDKTFNRIVIKNADNLSSTAKNLTKIQSDILGLYNLNVE